MVKVWSDRAWEEYVWWQEQDRKTLRKINKLIADIERNGESEGIGKPEPLKENLSGYWSRHINDKDRLIYRINEDHELEIAQCRAHYGDK